MDLEHRIRIKGIESVCSMSQLQVKDNVGGNKPREDDHAEGSCISFVSNNLI